MAILLSAATVATALLHVPAMERAAFDTTRCHRFALTDRASGRTVFGAEDIAIAPTGDLLLVSAYDRRGRTGPGEDAPDSARADGNLYAIPLAALARRRYAAVPLVTRTAFDRGFHPHGFTITAPPTDSAEAGSTLLVVIRRDAASLHETAAQRPSTSGGARQGGSGAPGASLEVFHLEPAAGAFDAAGGGSSRGVRLTHLASLHDERLCRANDLAHRDHRLFVTLDRAACESSWRDTIDGATGRLMAVDIDPATGALSAPEIVADGVAFANGVVQHDATGQLVVAQTRGDALLSYAPDATVAGRLAAPISLPLAGGGGDNLSLAPDGRIVAPVHPHLVRLALARSAPWLGVDAGSRVVAIDPRSGVSEVLFDDPTGRLFEGATSAVLTGEGTLVMGSATDSGLLVCRHYHSQRRIWGRVVRPALAASHQRVVPGPHPQQATATPAPPPVHPRQSRDPGRFAQQRQGAWPGRPAFAPSEKARPEPLSTGCLRAEGSSQGLRAERQMPCHVSIRLPDAGRPARPG